VIPFRTIGSLLGAGALVAALLFVAGCDEHAVDDGAQEVVFDVSPLFWSAAGESCVTVVDTLVLTVTAADGAVQRAGRRLAPGDIEVRIPVEVEPGTVTFEAVVLSNNETRLYEGSATADVRAEGFRVEVELDAVNAVLKACPGLVLLDRFDTAYRGELRVINRGSLPVSWEATTDPSLCDGVPCVTLDPSRGTLGSEDTTRVTGSARTTTLDDAFDVRITSLVGTLDVQFFIETVRPVTRPDTAVVLERGTVEIDVLANDDDPEGDELTLIGIGPVAFGSAGPDGDFVYYTADYAPLWGATSEDGFTYVADAGGRRAQGTAVVLVDPCMTFETAATEEVADVPLYTENNVTAFTRAFQFRSGESDFRLARVLPLDQSGDLALYLENAAVEFDWSQQPVRYIQFDFRNEAEVVNVRFNDDDVIIEPDVVSMSLPPDLRVQVEPGGFDGSTRVLLEADPDAPIERLLLGGGDELDDDDTLILDNICFGLAPPDDD
jgi:hypothetical protein